MPILKSIRNHKTVSNNDNWEYFGGGWRRSRPKTSRVVIDTHAHLFPRLGKSKGWDHNIHTKLSQNHMRDFNTFWRKNDNVRVDGLLLDYPSDDIEQMPNLNFRIILLSYYVISSRSSYSPKSPPYQLSSPSSSSFSNSLPVFSSGTEVSIIDPIGPFVELLYIFYTVIMFYTGC